MNEIRKIFKTFAYLDLDKAKIIPNLMSRNF